MDVHVIVLEAVVKTISKKKNCKKAKWLSDEALQIAEKRREAKGKGEKEWYNHLNAEFQRITRRDKKAFLNDQCKEIEENNRMGKTGDLFKKIKDTKGTSHAKMSTIKESNDMDSILNIHWKDWCWSWNVNTLATWCEELTHWKRLWCWERLRAGGQGDDRGWDSWMASLTQRTWDWVNSRSWWWTRRPGMLQSIRSQRVGHNWETELNW